MSTKNVRFYSIFSIYQLNFQETLFSNKFPFGYRHHTEQNLTPTYCRILQNSMGATNKDEGPSPLYRTEMAIFYIVFFIVFPFFFVNIFVALIIITFQEQGEAELQDGEIDKNQVDFSHLLSPQTVRV